MDSSTSPSEASENAFVFITSLVSFGVCIEAKYFYDVVRHRTSNIKYLLELLKLR